MVALYIILFSVTILLFLFFVFSGILCIASKWTDAEYHHTERKGNKNIIFYEIDNTEIPGFFPAECKSVGKRLYEEGKKYRVLYNEKKKLIMDKTMIITEICGLFFSAVLIIILTLAVL